MQTVANQIAIAIDNARLYQVAVEKAHIERELALARSVQGRFLPHSSPKVDGWDLSARWRPAREVSGDFYDFIPLADGRLGIVIGDATGKGMPAALVMATTRAVIRTAAQGSLSPGLVLERVNDLLCPDMPPKMFVTCFYGILDPNAGVFRFANAGQNLPYLSGKGGIDKLCATGVPLGLMEEMKYEEVETAILPGEDILFYSDGLVEAHNRKREMFGSTRLAKALSTGRRGSALIDLLLQEISKFGPDLEQEDDITIMTLSRLDSH